MKEQFWDKRSEKYEQGLKQNRQVVSKTLEWSKKYLHETDKVLDFGCATGAYSFRLANHVCSLLGIDTSQKMIAMANQKKSQKESINVSFRVADINTIQTEGNRYSAILALSVLHLTESIAANLRILNSILEENGYLISVTPCLKNRNVLFRFLVNVLQRIGVAPKIQSTSYNQLVALFNENGFNVEEAKVLDSKDALYWVVGKKVDDKI